ncbi:MAG: protein kinase [Candidatus Margulisiibacteriota bacterium]
MMIRLSNVGVGSVYRTNQPVKTIAPKELAKRLEALYCQSGSPTFAHLIYLKKCIGVGGTGVVFLAELRNRNGTTAELAVKIASGNMRKTLRKEVLETMNLDSSPQSHFIKWWGDDAGPVIDGSPTYFAAYNFIAGETIFNRMQRKSISVFWSLNITSQIAEALHLSGKTHKDLKRSNIMLVFNYAIIIDFGSARTTSSFTLLYASPEQLRGEILIDQKTDVYSLGYVLWEMLSGQRALSCVGEETVKNLLAAKEVPLPPIPNLPGGENINALITWMTQPNPQDRPTHEDVVATINWICFNNNIHPT